MSIHVRDSDIDESARWDAFLRQAENGTFYGLSVWGRAVEILTRQRVRRVAALDAAGEFLAGLQVGIRAGVAGRIAGKPWATAYCGVAYRPGLSPRVKLHVNDLLAERLAASYDYVRLETAPTFRDILGFQRRGWILSVKNTYLLAGGVPLLDQVEPAVRRQVARARRAGVVVREADDAGAFFDMYRDCYAGQGRRLPFGRDDFCRFWQILREGGDASLWYACEGGAEVAGMLIGRMGPRHYYSLAAFRRECRELAAPTLLLHDYISERVAAGHVFDFIGANPYTPGITAFKSKFNPAEAPYLVLECWSLRHRFLFGPARGLVRGVRHLLRLG
jgi:hypothetical protein